VIQVLKKLGIEGAWKRMNVTNLPPTLYWTVKNWKHFLGSQAETRMSTISTLVQHSAWILSQRNRWEREIRGVRIEKEAIFPTCR
jgi:hypothetical protein